MARRSNKSIQEILGQSNREFISFDDGDKELDRKITLVTEGFTTTKYCELILRDRTRLSKENALTTCDYIIAMKREINPRLNTIRTTIQFLSELCKCVDSVDKKRFEDMTRDDILLFLDHAASQKTMIRCTNGLTLIIQSDQSYLDSSNGYSIEMLLVILINDMSYL
jgi:hypothetical protein